MTRCIPCIPKVLSASFSVVLLAGLYAVSWMPGSLVAQTPGANGLTYQLNETWIEGGGGSTTLQVHQAGDAAVARYESGERIALVSNQTAGILSARPDRWFPILIETVDVPESLGPGSEMLISDDEVRALESISFKLERGDSDRTLEGYQAEHRVLTIDLKLREVGTDGRFGSEIAATGRADLWTAPDLPFSWLPYTSPNYYAWALPLSFSYPQVTANVLAELSDELSGLGLLLRAEIRSSIAIGGDGFGYNQEFIREVKVEGLEEAAGPLDMTPFNQPVLALSSYKYLMGGLTLAGEFCTREVPAGTSSLTLKANKTREISGDGVARVEREAGQATVLVLGSLDPSSTEQGPGCITIVTESTGPEPGEYALAAPSDGWDAAPTQEAQVYYLRGTEESPQVTLIEAGTLNVESAGPGESVLQAELSGTGWTANLTPSSASLIKDVAFELFFEFDAPSADQTLADAVTVPAEVEPWSSLTFNPVLNKPVAEWTFGGGVSRGVTLDSRGRYAAVALVSEPKIILLDLESRSQLGELDVERDSGGKHVSSLAFGPSGNRLAIGLPMGKVRIVDMTTRETLQELQYSKDGRSSSVASLKFDPAGSRVLGATNGEIVAWDIDSGEVLSTWGAGRITNLAFTPDGTRVAAVVSGSVKIWESQTGSEICELPGDFLSLAMHPAGDRLAVSSFEQKVVVASTSDCSEIAAWPTTPSFVPAIAWAADGKHLILGSGDGPLYVYTEQGESAGVWSGPSQGSLVFTSPGSSRVLSTDLSRSEESKVFLWENE